MLPYYLQNMIDLYIHKSVVVHRNKAVVDEKTVFEEPECENMGAFLKQLYKFNELSYGKFFKMDRLSKLGFLTAEMLLQNTPAVAESHNTAIILANSAASLETDHNYQQTIDDIPSPAVFVYTLANIVIGEICIRHDIKGETAFFVQETFDARYLINYAKVVFSGTQTQQCLLGWVEADHDGSYKSMLALVKPTQSNLILNEFNLNNIFNTL